jgi:hypothetical protein
MFTCETCNQPLSSTQTGNWHSLDLNACVTSLYYDVYQETSDVKTFCCQACQWEYEAVYRPIPYSFDGNHPHLCEWRGETVVSADCDICDKCREGLRP